MIDRIKTVHGIAATVGGAFAWWNLGLPRLVSRPSWRGFTP